MVVDLLRKEVLEDWDVHEARNTRTTRAAFTLAEAAQDQGLVEADDGLTRDLDLVEGHLVLRSCCGVQQGEDTQTTGLDCDVDARGALLARSAQQSRGDRERRPEREGFDVAAVKPGNLENDLTADDET